MSWKCHRKPYKNVRHIIRTIDFLPDFFINIYEREFDYYATYYRVYLSLQ